MFKKILIANRGEIACRVIATARKMGIITVAVYSEADAQSRHVALADEAYPIGPAPARQSYLVTEAILDAAKRSGAQAIHPGYGFLSENAAFADACAAAGVVFIGPPAAAIRAMGSKSAAKALMEKSGVPLVPGYHGENQDLATLTAAADRIGYPVLLKASAGGGGKGMRVVETHAGLQAALEGAKREALASFGDDRMLVERYLTRPRHIEIQVFADTHGDCVSLFERDCSIQRRHQKVLEEAPAPGMHPARRAAMGEAAIAAARAVGYVGAGTVEFIAEGNAFYFMEMNTRLQVEHPVTEMITGQDLVEWQLRVAFGERLPRTQAQLHINGHAIEARVYAEDPARDFLPSIGTLTHLHQPTETPNIRVDTGVREGDAISPHYDPMIAKLIVWGEDRAAALQRLSQALAEYQVVGVQTNLALLRAIAGHPAFGAGTFDTGFIGRHAEVLMPPVTAASPAILAAAMLTMMADPVPTSPSEDQHSPWNTPDAWRMNGAGYQVLTLRDGETVMTIRAEPGPDGVRLTLPTGPVLARPEPNGLRLDGVAYRLRVVRQGEAIIVIQHASNHILHPVDQLAPPASAASGGGKVMAPIPGRVVRILVAPGDSVLRGAALLVIEAMKMELTLSAPMDGVVATIRPAVDEMVQEGTELVTFVVDEPTPPA
jgi:3-methylcrotonyl-CoA carboxylase alpha subunit